MPENTTVTESIRKRLSHDHYLIGLVIIIGSLIYFPGLGDLPLHRWDEALYANSARHMVQEGHWLVPHTRASLGVEGFSLTPRLQKAPLMYWLQAVSMLLFGITEFAVRLPSALAGIGTACLTYLIGRDVYDRWTGSAAAMVLLVLPPMYLETHAARTGDSDMLLVLFGSAFVWWAWRSREDAAYLLPAGIAAGLAVLTKGFAAGIFLFVLAPIVLANLPTYFSRDGLRAAMATAVIAIPWPLYVWSQFGDRFVDQFVVRTVIRRVTRNISSQGVEPLFEFMNYPYFKSLRWYFSSAPIGPLFLLLLAAGVVLIGCGLFVRGVGNKPGSAFLVWWTGIVPVAFAVLGGNHPWYILPMAIPAAVIIGRVLAFAVAETNGYFTHRTGGSLVGYRTYLALGLVATVVLAIVYPSMGIGLGDREQRELGMAFEQNMPAGETVYIESNDGKINDEDLQVFSFYIRSSLENTTIDRLNTDRTIRYALIRSTSIQDIRREFEILARAPHTGVVAIELELRSTGSPGR